MADEVEEVRVPESLLTFNKTGTVEAFIRETTHTLRRPTIGELRKLRELLWETQDRLEEQAGPLNDARRKLTEAREEAKATEGDEGTETLVAALDEVTRLTRQWQEVNEDANLAWMQAAFDMLGDSGTPATDDLPIWAAQTATIDSFIEHWKTHPLARGVD